MDRLTGKKAFVTGAASGLGKAAAEGLAREGAAVALSDIDLAGAEAAAAAIRQSGGTASAHRHDVAVEGDWISALAAADEAMGGLNVLVNNAGIGHLGTIENTSFEDWRRVMAIDLDSVFLGCKHAIPLMRPHAPGSIVNISSISGIIASEALAAYCTAKAGVWMLSKSVALHCAKRDYAIRCNSVHPTFIDTPILDMFPGLEADTRAEKLARQIPMGRIGTPDDVANMVIYLASDESGFVTGSEFKVDGGISAL